MAKAYQWATLAMGIAVSMVVPAVVGYLLDQWLGWKGVFVSVGALIGLVLGIYRLAVLSRSGTRPGT
jgi:F0F1-type ATP synthase assembly protein I